MSFNLIRNSRVFFTTNVDSVTGVVAATGFLPANTQEIQVLDGFSFSQNATNETITLKESGATPSRGQRSYNTSLDPVDWSFSTYVRPADGGVNITAEEGVLWNAMMGTGAIGTGTAAWVEGTSSAVASFTNSQAHQMQKFGLIIVIDTVSYIIDNCAIESATIDFGLDSIAAIAWTGKGGILRQVTGLTASTGATVTLAVGLTGTAKGKNTTAPYIANKLSTMTLAGGISGGGTNYTVALTGGSVVIANNLTYLTPSNLGIVNKPVTYFTGTRSITGSIDAYLRLGATNTAGLLSDILATSATDTDPEFAINISVGGTANTTKLVLAMPAVVLQIPTISAAQVIATNIKFTAQGYNGTAFDITATNEFTATYFTANA